MKIADPAELNAVQWFRNGDHPGDNTRWINPEDVSPEYRPDEPFLSEGKVVRYYRNPYVPSDYICAQCGSIAHYHGWIDESPGGRTVCPGDYVVEFGGEHFPMKADLYEALIAERV